VPCLVTLRVVLDPGTADFAYRPAAAGAATGTRTFGTASRGNRAPASVRAGTGTATVAGVSIARIVAAIRVAYGRPRAINPSTPNQNRWRRLSALPNVPLWERVAA
jgi:hypothetical protein